MSSVMIRCPTTGSAVSTEIETEPAVFRRLPNVISRMHCPACGQEHVWRPREAWLAGTPRPVETPAETGRRVGTEAA
jgi:predicted RNA-binding Zn-ribbon protein involved in translation (DUF1610 family)